VSKADHNHNPSTSKAAHPTLRRLNAVQREELGNLTAAHVPPQTIDAILSQNGKVDTVFQKDVYKAQQRLRNVALAGRTPIQALVEQLGVEDFVWHVQADNEGHVTQLFFAYKDALTLYESYPEVLLIDCTYKTNRYRMPLCVIAGITGVNTTFIVAMAFLKQERECDYSWVLDKLSSSAANFPAPGVVVTDRDLALMNALAHSFPDSKHLLCRWHIRKNIEARCLPSFKDLPTTSACSAEVKWAAFLADWDNLVSLLSLAEYNRQLNSLQTRHRLHAFALQYTKTVWLDDHKERFVYAWTHKHLHLSTIVTSRVEGCHSVLKRYISVSSYFPLREMIADYIQVASGDLLKVYNDIHACLRDQHRKFRAETARQLATVAHRVNVPFYAPLIGKVISYALNKLANELSRSRKPDFPRVCTGTFARTMGMPCGHELKRKYDANSPLQPSEIHRHWFYIPSSAHTDFTPVRGSLLLNTTMGTGNGATVIPAEATESQQEASEVYDSSEPVALSTNTNVGYASSDARSEQGTVTSQSQVPAPIPPTQVPLLEPVEVEPRGRRPRSTRRDPSLFETVGVRVRRRRAREAAARE
jgi:hypothetical protein